MGNLNSKGMIALFERPAAHQPFHQPAYHNLQFDPSDSEDDGINSTPNGSGRIPPIG